MARYLVKVLGASETLKKLERAIEAHLEKALGYAVATFVRSMPASGSWISWASTRWSSATKTPSRAAT